MREGAPRAGARGGERWDSTPAWRTSIFLRATGAIGGTFVGLALRPGATGRLRLGLALAGAIRCAFFTAVLGREIARHWYDRADDA